MYIALSAFHWEFFIYSFDILYGRWIRWNFRHVISLLTHFDFRIWLIWLFFHIGKTRAEGFSNRWTWNRNYHIYIDLKIRLLQKRENERLNGCFKYTKNGINSVQYIPVHNKAQKHIYLCMHAFMLDPQSRPYFLFNKAFNQDALEYKTQNPAMLFTKRIDRKRRILKSQIFEIFFSLKLL